MKTTPQPPATTPAPQSQAQAQAEAAQAEAEKVKAAENAFRHAFLARNTLIHGERAEAFLELADLLTNTFQPTNEHERILVDTMTISMWRRTRALAIESAGLSFIYDKQLPASAHPHSRTNTFHALVANPEQQRILDLMHRYEIRHTRAYDRAFKTLMAYRKMRKTDPDLFPAPAPEPDLEPQPEISPDPEPTPEPPTQPEKQILPYEPEPGPVHPRTESRQLRRQRERRLKKEWKRQARTQKADPTVPAPPNTAASAQSASTAPPAQR